MILQAYQCQTCEGSGHGKLTVGTYKTAGEFVAMQVSAPLCQTCKGSGIVFAFLLTQDGTTPYKESDDGSKPKPS